MVKQTEVGENEKPRKTSTDRFLHPNFQLNLNQQNGQLLQKAFPFRPPPTRIGRPSAADFGGCWGRQGAGEEWKWCQPSFFSAIPENSFVTKCSASNWILCFYHEIPFLGPLHFNTKLFTQTRREWILLHGKERFGIWFPIFLSPASPKMKLL